MYKYLKPIRWKLYPYYSRIVATVVFLILRIIKKNNQVIVLLHQYLGDQLYALSCLDIMKSEWPTKKIKVIAPDNNENVVRSFREIDELVVLPFKGVRYLALQCLIRNNKFSETGIKHDIYNATPITYKRFRDNAGESAREMLIKYIFQLNSESPITYHNVEPEKITAIDNFEANKHRIVVINPYSFSTGYSEELFKNICAVLIEHGYMVFTNVIKDQKPIQGSLPLKCSLQELYNIAGKIPLIISARSGVIDYVISTGVNLFVIYETGKWITGHYDLNEWKPKGVVYQVIAEEDSSNADITAELVKILEEIEVKGKNNWNT